MRFLCKKCGAHSPGDISEVEIRDGALVFTCKACGASATLVENRATGGAPISVSGKPAEKGIVEPDEEELVDLGEATLSRMLGKKVRIVAEDDADPAEAAPVLPGPANAAGAAVEPAPAAEPKGRPAPVVAPEERPLPAFASELEPPSRTRRSRVFLAIAASVGLVAVATVALLEARPQRPASGSAPVSAAPADPGSALPTAASEPEPVAAQPEQAPAATPSAAPSGPARKAPAAEAPATRVELRELVVPTLSAVATEQVGKGLSAEQVEVAFFRVRPAVRMCAVQEQRRNPEAMLGSETVTLTVSPSGDVAHVEFESHELAGTPLGACLALELKKLHVEAFTGSTAVVRRVLELSRQSAPAS